MFFNKNHASVNLQRYSNRTRIETSNRWFDCFMRHYLQRYSNRTRIETSLHRAIALIRAFLSTEVFQQNKDWNWEYRWRSGGSAKSTEVFQQNKDWNDYTLPRRNIQTFIYRGIPTEQGLKPGSQVVTVKSNESTEVFQQNKDWNDTRRLWPGAGYRIYRGIPTEQGLKHLAGRCIRTLVSPYLQRYSNRTRIETRSNEQIAGFLPVCYLQRYSNRTRIETERVLYDRGCVARIYRGIPTEQGLKLDRWVIEVWERFYLQRYSNRTRIETPNIQISKNVNFKSTEVFQQNKDWNRDESRQSAHQSGSTEVFQQNKDWNHSWRQSFRGHIFNLQRYSNRTRIETCDADLNQEKTYDLQRYSNRTRIETSLQAIDQET